MIIHKYIYKLHPNVVSIAGDIAFDEQGNEVPYDKKAIQAAIDADEYQRQRATAYPSIQDQLDMLYHGGYDAWKASIEEVKNKFPKTE